METSDFNWHSYNESQTREKVLFLYLLKELCNTLKEPLHQKGRNPATLRHQLFCMCTKVYENTSSRRLISELELCRKAQYIYSVPHFNSIINYFNNPDLTPILKQLIEVSAIPLAQLERRFAVDSTGFSLRILADRWSIAKLKYIEHHKFMKAHVMYGTLTNVAVGCEVTQGNSGDSPQFKPLLSEAAKHFAIEEISADKAYSSRENVKFAFELGAFPLIPFRSNSIPNSVGVRAWSRLYKYFKDHNEHFMSRYHLRSNAETGFWMIKQRFGQHIKSRNTIGQTNEILCKVLCHNIAVLVQETFLSGLETDFYRAKEAHTANIYQARQNTLLRWLDN